MATKEVGIRLSVKDKEIVERALKSLGSDGEEALKRIGRAAETSSVSLQALDVAANGVNRGFERLKTGVALAAAGIATGFVLGLKGAVERLEQMDKLSAQVDRALANTGNTAQTSSAELADFADALEARTGRAAEEIMAIGGNLATFKFDHEVFYRSIELANDMSAAWGGELKQNLEGLSRALADPEQGFAMLQKRGISLTETQGDMVKRFMAINDLASAQRVILDALEADVRGVAEQGMTPMERATRSAEKAMEDLFEDLVRGEGGGDDLRVSIEKVANTLSDPNVLSAVRMFGNVLVESLRLALEFIGGVAAGLQRLMDFFTELEGKSDAALDERLYDVGREIVTLDAERLGAQSSVRSDIPAWDIGGQIGDSMARGELEGIEGRMAELRAEEAQILAMIEARKAAANLTKPLPTVTVPGSGGGELPPPVLTKDQERAQSQALREAERLTERLRTASEQYAAALAEADAMLSQGTISQETHSRAMAEAVLEFANAASSADEYRFAHGELQKALAAGIISEMQYTDALESLSERRLTASNDWISGLQGGLEKIAQQGQDFGGDIADTLVGAAGSFEDALVNAFQTGKFEWKDLANEIAADVLRLTVRQGIAGLSSLATSIFQPAGTPQLQLGYQAGVGHTGAMIGSSAVSRTVPADLFLRAQRHHSGTDFLKPGEVPFIGMRGEEIGWPEQLRRKYGGQSSVTVQAKTDIINNAGAEVSERTTSDGRGGVRQEIVIDRAVAGAYARPGSQSQRALRTAGLVTKR